MPSDTGSLEYGSLFGNPMIKHIQRWFETGLESILAMNHESSNEALMAIRIDVTIRKWAKFMQDSGYFAGWKLVDAKTGCDIKGPKSERNFASESETGPEDDVPQSISRGALSKPLATLKAQSWGVENFDFFLYARFLSFSIAKAVHVCIYFVAIDKNRRVTIQRKDIAPGEC